MDQIFLLLLGVLKFSLSKSEPGVFVNVEVNVNYRGPLDGDDGGDGGEREELLGQSESSTGNCSFGNTSYPNWHSIEDSCIILLCENGDWIYHGQILKACGRCLVWGEPHFVPFDRHAYSPSGSHVTYDFQDVGTHVLTQNKIGNTIEFGLTSTFYNCVPELFLSCVYSMTYTEPGIQINTEPGIQIKVVVPTAGAGPIKVFVNWDTTPTVIDNSVNEIRAKDGTGPVVLVFADNRIGINDTNCVNIVGSKGLSMSLCQRHNAYAWLYVFAMQHLKADTSILYGLCDKFTGYTDNDYTLRDDSVTSGATIPEINKFARSWAGDHNRKKRSTSEVEKQHHNRIKRSNIVERCTNDRVLFEIETQCTTITADVCNVISPSLCTAFNESCVFDLCRVENPDLYALGYASHMQFHTQISPVYYV